LSKWAIKVNRVASDDLSVRVGATLAALLANKSGLNNSNEKFRTGRAAIATKDTFALVNFSFLFYNG